MLDMKLQKLIDEYGEREAGIKDKVFPIRIEKGTNFNIVELSEFIDGNALDKGLENRMREAFNESSYNKFSDYVKEKFTEEINQKLKEWGLFINKETEMEISKYINKEYKLRDIFSEMLENTKLENFCLHIGEEGKSYLMKELFFNSYEKAIERINTKEIIQASGINWLIQSQGYEFKDLWDEKMLNKSKFLKTIREEFTFYKNNSSGLELVIYIGDVSLKKITNIVKNDEKLLIPKEAICGLFDKKHHDASLLNIQFEKDIVLPKEKVLLTTYKHWCGSSIHHIFSCAYNTVYGKGKLRDVELIGTKENERFVEKKIIDSKRERFETAYRKARTPTYKNDVDGKER